MSFQHYPQRASPGSSWPAWGVSVLLLQHGSQRPFRNLLAAGPPSPVGFPLPAGYTGSLQAWRLWRGLYVDIWLRAAALSGGPRLVAGSFDDVRAQRRLDGDFDGMDSVASEL